MSGRVGILNVGSGDTKLVFDNTNPAETIRAARIVKDMLRRGYALLIEISSKEGDKPSYQRALDFDENTCEYIIADYDSEVVADEEVNPDVTPKPKKDRITKKRIAASTTNAISVARSAGG